MSLGVRQLWGFWRRASLAPRVSSLIPREPLLLTRNPPPSPAAAAAAFSSLPRRGRQARAMRSLSARNRNGKAVGKSATTPRTTAHKPNDGGSNTGQSRSALFIERLSKFPVRAADTHLPVVVNIYPRRNQRIRQLVRLSRDLLQQRHVTERFRLQNKPPARDWRRILKTLLDNTPVYTPPNLGALKVFIPESLVPRLTTDPVDNIWEIKSRSGCEIKVHERKPDDAQDKTYFLLSGDRSAIDRVVADLRRVVPSDNEIRTVPLAEEDVQSLQEHVSPIPWKREPPVRQKYYLYRPLHEIKKPETWTFDTFEHYITSLIYAQLPPGRGYELTGGRDHTKLVARALIKAFRNPAALPALNATSFKHALKFLALRGVCYWHFRKELFHMMASRGFEITTDVYDTMSLAALANNDIGFFHFHVKDLAKNGLYPSVKTWTHFLRMVKSEEIRRYILHAMASKGLLDHPSAMHLVSREMIENDVYRAIRRGFNVQSFVKSQNQLYGPEWLNWQTSNKVLYELGSYGKFDEIDEFLTVMFQSAQARPKDEIALNIILTHCRCYQRLNDAIRFLRRFEEEVPVCKPNGVTYHLLSTMAWQMKKPNTLSVLWRYSHFKLLAPRYLTLRFHELLSPTDARKHTRRRFTKGLRITGVFHIPKDGRFPVGYTREKRQQSTRSLRLFIENLFLCDYKREMGIDRDQLLTSEEFWDAIKEWYPKTFRQQKPAYKLSELLAMAVAEDRKNIMDSREGKEINAVPLPITSRTTVRRVISTRTPEKESSSTGVQVRWVTSTRAPEKERSSTGVQVRWVTSTRTPEKESSSTGVQGRSQLYERGPQAGDDTRTLDLGENHSGLGLVEMHKVDEEREVT